MITDGARLAQTPSRKSALTQRLFQRAKPDAGDAGGAAKGSKAKEGGEGKAKGKGKGKAAETDDTAAEASAAPSKAKGKSKAAAEGEARGAVTEDEYPPSEGMHIAIDAKRKPTAPLPDAFTAIETARPPAKSNVGVVTAIDDDGRCACQLVSLGEKDAGRCLGVVR